MGSGGQRSIKKRPLAAVAAKQQSNLDKFVALTDSQKGQEVTATLRKSPARRLVSGGQNMYETPFQKFANVSGYDDKPTIVDDAAMDNMPGIEVYRTVNSSRNISAMDIANQIGSDDICLYNTAGGGQAMGKGLYVTPSITGSMNYGNDAHDPRTGIMRFKIKDSAKIINYSDLKNQFDAEARTPGTLASEIKWQCRIADHDSRYGHISNAQAIWALAKGYSVVTQAHGHDQKSLRAALANGGDQYTTILNRGALYMSKTVKEVDFRSPWKRLAKNADLK